MRYLQYYCKLSSWYAYDGWISGIDLDGMTFICNDKLYRIPFDPPMSSYREARERVVQMDKEALHGLGLSEITINEFLPPTGVWAIGFAMISAAFLAYSQRWWFEKGQIVDQVLGPGFARFSWTIQPYLIIFMLSIHTTEMLYFMRYKLAKHSVNPRTLLFWQWAGTAFIEGGFAFSRFNGLVKTKQEEKAKQKH